MLLQPDASLTDFLLALEALGLAAAISRAPKSVLKSPALLLFLSFSLSSLLGGFFHGFFPNLEHTPPGWRVWLGILLAVGVTALALWRCGFALIGFRHTRYVNLVGSGLIGIYLAYVILSGDSRFFIALLFTLPPLLFLALLFIRRRNGWGLFSMGMTFLAAAGQQLEFAVWGLSYNAVYHVLQGIALFLLFLAFRPELSLDS